MVKTITMAELMKKKPPSPQDQHRERVGKVTLIDGTLSQTTLDGPLSPVRDS